MSQPFSFRIPYPKPLPTKAKPEEYDKVKDLLAADATRPWYQTLRFKAYLVLAIVAFLIVVCAAGCAALISMKYYDWFQSPAAKERRKRKKVGFFLEFVYLNFIHSQILATQKVSFYGRNQQWSSLFKLFSPFNQLYWLWITIATR